MLPRNYADALAFAQGGRSQYGRNVPGLVGTRIFAENRQYQYAPEANGHIVVVQYHATEIVIFHANGDMTINFGGWHTNTTRLRINGCLPVGWKVYQKNWTTYLRAPDGRETAMGDRMLITAEQIRRGKMLPFAGEQTA